MEVYSQSRLGKVRQGGSPWEGRGQGAAGGRQQERKGEPPGTNTSVKVRTESNCLLCTFDRVLCTVCWEVCTLYWLLYFFLVFCCIDNCLRFMLFFVLCTMYCVLCTVYCVLCTVYCVLCTVYC